VTWDRRSSNGSRGTERTFSRACCRPRPALSQQIVLHCWPTNGGVLFLDPTKGWFVVVLVDILIAIVIVIIAGVLGLVVHPLLWIIVIVAVLWLFGRRGRW
jgi:hypothetical protein